MQKTEQYIFYAKVSNLGEGKRESVCVCSTEYRVLVQSSKFQKVKERILKLLMNLDPRNICVQFFFERLKTFIFEIVLLPTILNIVLRLKKRLNNLCFK